jgi:hypothetical protein
MTPQIAHLIAARTMHYCPCCRDRIDASDMDLGMDWHHSQAMRDRYGAACCRECTDAHRMSVDGVLCAPDEGDTDEWGDLWSSQDALDEAAEDGRDWERQKANMRAWQ